jgi:hypothetical protein
VIHLAFERIGEGSYQLRASQLGVALDISRLRRDRHDLVGELAVSCNILGSRQTEGGYISLANFNLSNARARQDRARSLQERARAKVDWATLLEELCQRVLAAERAGEPAVILRDLATPPEDEEINIDGLVMPSKHGTILFGDGGSCKSLLQLLVGGRLAMGGIRVVYIDWELDQWTHRGRLERLFPEAMPDVRYVRCDRPLVYEVDRLATIIRREQIDYALFDSVGFACDGPPEAAECALGYFRAVRQLGVGGLHTAHITKNGENSDQRPFGSTYWHNSARCTWFVKQAGTSVDGQGLTIGLLNRKSNLGPMRPAVAFDVSFANGRTTFTHIDAGAVDELATALPLRERIRGVLKTGLPRTIAALAEELNAKQDSVEKTLKRNAKLFTLVQTGDGVHRYALLERRAS